MSRAKFYASLRNSTAGGRNSRTIKLKPKFINKRDHEMYELTIGKKMGADGLEPCYQLRNQFHYHECSEKEFRENFTKV